MENNTLVEVKHLHRYYGELCALDDVSFTVPKGEIVGILGPNGAGKSTAMQILSGNLAPSAGQIKIAQLDILDKPKQAKGLLGYLPEQPPLYDDLKVDEYLRYCGQLHGLQGNDLKTSVEKVKERCGLHHRGQSLIAHLSKGYRQRVGIAQALVHIPELLILDEPTTGLDPIQILEIRNLIRELKSGHSVILSTHILPEVESLCDRVMIINQGRLIFFDTLEELQTRRKSTTLILKMRKPPTHKRLLNLSGITEVEQINEEILHLHVEPQIENKDLCQTLVKTAAAEEWDLYEIYSLQRSFEDVFTEITRSDTQHQEAS